jgi:hypothetical protein
MADGEPQGPSPNVGDELILDDDITLEDLVAFHRRPDGKLGLRRLRTSEVDSFTGEVLRVEPGGAANSRRLRVFRPPHDRR